MKTVALYFTRYKVIYWLLGAVVALEIADGLITYLLLKHSLGREGNPLLGNMPGDPKFILVKTLAGILCAFILYDICRRWPRLGNISTSLIVVALSGVVLWNVYAYFVSVA